jgi:polyhydroxyalkanoate synthesis regulator phasin
MMKIREDGFVHFDGPDDSLVTYAPPTVAANNTAMDNLLGAIRKADNDWLDKTGGPFVTSGGLPAFVGSVNRALPTDSGGPTTDEAVWDGQAYLNWYQSLPDYVKSTVTVGPTGALMLGGAAATPELFAPDFSLLSTQTAVVPDAVDLTTGAIPADDSAILEQIRAYANTPNVTEADVFAAMQSNNVTTDQVSRALGIPLADVQARYNALAADTTTTDTAVVSDAVDLTTGATPAELSAVEKILVQTYGYKDNGDGTLTDPNGSIYDTEQGGVVTAPVVTAPVVTPGASSIDDPQGLLEGVDVQGVQDFLATNPTPQDIAANMVLSGISSEQMALILGVTPAEAQQQFIDVINPMLQDKNPSSLPFLWEKAKEITGTIANTVKNAADTVFTVIQDLAPFWNQAQVVLDPINGKATIVFGNPPSGAPVVPVTTLPSTQTKVGVTTGIPILDAMINSVMDNPGGVDKETVRATVIDILAKQANIDPGVLSAAGGAAGLEDIIEQVSAAASAAYEAKNTLTVGVVPDEEETTTTGTGTGTTTTDTGTDTTTTDTTTTDDAVDYVTKAEFDAGIGVTGTDLRAGIDSLGTQVTGLGTQLTASEEKILKRIAELEQSDISRDDARDIALQEYADAFADELRGQLGDVSTDISNLAKKLGTTEEKLRGAYDILSKEMGEGFANTKAGQDALAELIGVTGNELRAGIDSLGTQVTGLGTQLEDVRADVTQQITDLVAAGVDQQTATETAIQEYADANNLSFAEVNKQLGLVGGQITDLGTQLEDVRADVTQQITDLVAAGVDQQTATKTAIQEYADANNLSFVEVNKQLGLVGGQITDLGTQLNSRIDELVAQGDTQAKATNKALEEAATRTGQSIDELRGQLGDVSTDISNLAEKLGTTEEKLRGAYDILSEQMGEGFGNTQAGQDALAELIGVTGTDLRAGIDSLGTQVTGLGTQLNSRIDELVAQGDTQAKATNKALEEAATRTGQSIDELRGQLGDVSTDISNLAEKLGTTEEYCKMPMTLREQMGEGFGNTQAGQDALAELIGVTGN